MSWDLATLLGLVYAAVPLVFLLLIILSRRARRHGGAVRASIAGAFYELQNKDKQKAIDVIVEGKAAQGRPEYAAGGRSGPKPH